MNNTQRILVGTLWFCAAGATAGVIGMTLNRAARQPDADRATLVLGDSTPPLAGPLGRVDGRPPLLGQVPAFAMRDQDDRPLTGDTLRGKPWVAAFIFTTCGNSCPMISTQMAKLQQAVPDPRVQLVSITVNPEYDTPVVLKDYAKRFNADEARWHFLTGNIDDIKALSRGLLLPMEPNQPQMHSDKLVLVDAAGRIRGQYHPGEADELKQLVADAVAVADESGPANPAPTLPPPASPAPAGGAAEAR